MQRESTLEKDATCKRNDFDDSLCLGRPLHSWQTLSSWLRCWLQARLLQHLNLTSRFRPSESTSCTYPNVSLRSHLLSHRAQASEILGGVAMEELPERCLMHPHKHGPARSLLTKSKAQSKGQTEAPYSRLHGPTTV